MRVTKRMRGRFKRKLLQMRRVKIKNLRRMIISETEQGSTHLMFALLPSWDPRAPGLLTLSTQERSGNTGVIL